MRHMRAILWKQGKDTLKNKEILIQFILFPVLTVIMENTITIQGMPSHFFANLFAVMYIGMAPLTSMASIISEEREKHTLKALFFSDVKAREYLPGIGIYVWCICMLGVGVIGVSTGYRGEVLLNFMAVAAVGILLSCFVGAVIGICSKTQMKATSVTVPVMVIFSFLPMIAMYNKSIEKIARVIYTQQIYKLMMQVEEMNVSREAGIVIGVNLILAAGLFFIVYQRNGLED